MILDHKFLLNGITRKNRTTPIPLSLREKAVALLEHYSSSQITRTLKLSGGQLKSWQQTLLPANQSQAFIELTPVIEPTCNHLELAVAFADSTTLSLSGEVTPTLLSTLVQAIRA